MNSRARRKCLAGLALLASACSATKVVTAWRAPDEGEVRFSKILALAISDDEAFRRAAEKAICEQVQPVDCQPASKVLTPEQMRDVAAAKAVVKAAGFDGAVVFRVVSEREKVTYVPPSYGPTFWGYYGYALNTAYAPAYYRSDTLVRVETSIYSVGGDRLIWVGTTETMNPKSVPGLVDEVAKAVGGDMRKQGLLAR
jgi:hypothetical protein